MMPLRSIAQKVTSPSRWGGLLWFLLSGLFGSSAFAQNLTISEAIVNIPEGVVMSTGGDITLEKDAALTMNGTLELKGDWVNHGKGIVEGSHGTVVLAGEDQVIGGTAATIFHNLSVTGSGRKDLQADIAVVARLDLQNCLLVTNGFAFSFDLSRSENFAWINGGIVESVGKGVSDFGDGLRSAGNRPMTVWMAAGTVAAVAPSSRDRQDEKVGASELPNTFSAGTCSAHAPVLPAQGQTLGLRRAAACAISTIHHASAGLGAGKEGDIALNNVGRGCKTAACDTCMVLLESSAEARASRGSCAVLFS